MQSAQSQHHSGGKFLGFPLEGFSLFQSLLLALTSAFFTFFATTTLSIFALLAYNLIGHHTVNYADSYLYVGFPAGLIVLLIALPLFGTLWIRAKMQR
ncbi:hypothetical protein P8935_06355 [Telmatobacter sp. DSM 110680]|uniref:Uncharacterized protein n=1 Tax=Telmatobacter sp. DSM 110680 TaxID=3036704 RepID=A0AAU7DM12_9BACT